MELSCEVRVHGIPSVNMIYICGNVGKDKLKALAQKIEEVCGEKAEVKVYALSVEVKIPASEELLIKAIESMVVAA